MLHLRRLSYFVGVLDHGTLMAASRALLVAQPALSRQIRMLEAELGLKLFARENGRLLPTPSAMELGKVARTLLDQAGLAERAVQSLKAGVVERLLCVSTRATNEAILTPFIRQLQTADPTITTREVEHGEVERSLTSGADFAVAPLPPSSQLASKLLVTFPVVATVSLEHPWAASEKLSVTLEELVGEPLILPPQSSISRQELDRSLRVNNLAVGSHLVSEVEPTSIALAANGRGVAVSTSSHRDDVWSMPIVSAAGDSPHLSLYICWHREHYASDVISGLAERLSAFVRDQNFRVSDIETA